MELTHAVRLLDRRTKCLSWSNIGCRVLGRCTAIARDCTRMGTPGVGLRTACPTDTPAGRRDDRARGQASANPLVAGTEQTRSHDSEVTLVASRTQPAGAWGSDLRLYQNRCRARLRLQLTGSVDPAGVPVYSS